ncbi:MULTISPECIES: DUF192 domain-containing protein [Gammaproteobacteria]|uniref:DUF192 domain-containing protein n=1 Tax=Gammaproteobacteria TaxID=1236 RepID=UPI000DD099BB|nr:DUF192 domain-containing protein [Aliidiomarina sp. B3213]RTE87162.1 DUF192 domain-containing protein [Aliidiomarina sp. B3213]TCZ93050.1 DUF192 domain-containing protein [Lysobacter sp. N42]
MTRSNLLKFIAPWVLGLVTLSACAQVTDSRPDVHSGQLYDFCVETGNGNVPIQVELAITQSQRARGLMYRENVPLGQGMLFIYERPRVLGFWMLNTLVALDIAYINSQNRIVQVGHMEPCENNYCPAFESDVPVAQALEMASGEFARLGIQVGATVSRGVCND